MARDIEYLTNSPKFMDRLYGYRLSEEKRQQVNEVFKGKFEGTKKYHNYTRDMKPE